MPIMEWTSSLSMNIEQIDTQHKKLFSYMNELYDALMQKKEKDVLTKIFDELEEYTHTHFGLEEEYFKKFHYNDAETHIKQHHEFIKTLGELKRKIIDDLSDPEDLLEFLVKWLMNHIKIVDHQYVDLFHNNGVA